MSDDEIPLISLRSLFSFYFLIGPSSFDRPAEDSSSSPAFGKSLEQSSAATSPVRAEALEPRTEEQFVDDVVLPQEMPRIEENLVGEPAGVQLLTGPSVSNVHEAAAGSGAVVGEGSGNNPSSIAVDAGAGIASSSKPGPLLLTCAGGELAKLNRVGRVAELLSSWETVSSGFGAVLKSFAQDQDLLFGPQEEQSAAFIEANLKRTESELAQVRAELSREKEQRSVMEATLRAQVADADRLRESALKAVAEAQAESSELRRGHAALAKEKELWMKEREEMTNTLRTSENQAESISLLADSKLKEA
ncbi:uncharacterized protein [Miscanthus floridulus]|uniref:uncharacterized protein n=1 Tax=Miscanthus floridulus TaxID=154761 RepID=UPI0034583399